MNLPILLIPAYKPSEKLIEIVKEIQLSNTFENIYCVNDGSSKKYNSIFEKLENIGVKIINHAVNMGKGMALRTGFNAILSNYPNTIGVVTCDADGQHLPIDVINVGKVLIDNSNMLIMGCRSFQKQNIPLRSKFGNILTKKVFSLISGAKVSDTQTGLRGIPAKLIPKLLYLKTTSYDFELDMLICAKELNIKFKEIEINTIYENGNATSSFNPLTDSLKIYFVFLRYIWVGLLSFAIDFLCFLLFLHIFYIPITYSNITARAISSTFNFLLNRKFVFKSNANILVEYLKYFTLMVYVATINTAIIYFTYNYVSKFSVGVKLFAEIVTFFVTFLISRSFVFKGKFR